MTYRDKMGRHFSLQQRIVRSLEAAGEDGLTTLDLAFDIYGENEPDTATASVRVQIARYNRSAGRNAIVAHGGTNQDRRWFMDAAYQARQARERGEITPAHITQAERIRARFAPGCAPRYGR